jgi:acyl-coenzyme A synthetase/AMP-(fatty) acid ligase
LYDAVSRAVRTGDAFAVLDPSWPKPFLGAALREVEAAAAGGDVGPGDMVVFSSGSTGRPRGIVRTIESWRASVAAFSDITGILAGDTVWLPGPLWSSLFLYGAFHAGEVGAHLTLLDGATDDSANATALHCVPTQLPGLLQRAHAGGLPLVRRVVVAGDHCAASLRAQCEAVGWQVVEYYGAAELSFVAWRQGGGPFLAFPGVETELRAGVLWARSPYLARGYLTDDATDDATDEVTGEDEATDEDEVTDEDEATDEDEVTEDGRAALSADDATRETAGPRGPLRTDQHGWATVSDLAREVPGGLEILGRGNSAVTSGGHTVVVEEVERLLRGLRGVEDVAVLGMSHLRLGQVVTAVVVGSAADDTLRAAVAGIPAPSRPRRWLHADALPRTSGGKLRRDKLPDLAGKLNQR